MTDIKFENLHPRAGTGAFTDKKQSAPEDVVLKPDMTADLTPKLSGGVLVVVLEGSDAAGAVFPGADEIVISKRAHGHVSATATINDLNIYELALEAQGGDQANHTDRAKASKWVHDNEDAVEAFWESHGISLGGTYFDEQTMSIRAEFPDDAPVTFETAAKALASTEGAIYLAAVSNVEESTLPADFLGFVTRYESEDNCRECGEDSSGGEGYDGYCGNCADVAEQAGEWD